MELVGRDDLLANLIDRLLSGKSPALSTAGMPGVGKTALALELIYRPEIQAHFRDGILWGSLSREPDVAGVQARWADALKCDLTGVSELQARTEKIGSAIGTRRMLVVIDDAWTLDPARLLRPGGNVTCLLTTRDEAIAQHFAPTQHIHVSSLEEDPSLELLRQLAGNACAADPKAASDLAKATGGVPLTLKVLGGYLAEPEHSQFPDLGKQAFKDLADPHKRLALAEARLGGRLDQEQTLEATINLSVEQLEQARPEAAAAFHALGAFAPKPATFDRTAAEAVTGTDGAVLALLIARNLLEGDTEGNLTLHQSLADCAGTRTPDHARARHQEHYLARVEKNVEDWQEVERIYSQFLHAWRQLAAASENNASVVRLVGAISTYQRHRGLRHDEFSCLQSALAHVQKKGEKGQTARLLNNLGRLSADLGDKREAPVYLEQARELYHQLDNRVGEATSLNNLGCVYNSLGDKRMALAHLQQARENCHQHGDRDHEANVLNNIGNVYSDLGDKQQALANYKQALELMHQIGDLLGEAIVVGNVGMQYSYLGDKQQALAHLEQSLALARRAGDLGSEANALNNIGLVYNANDDQQLAKTFLEQARELYRQVSDRAGEATSLNNIGRVHEDLGDGRKALIYYEQALELARQVRDPHQESITRYNIAAVKLMLGDLATAKRELEIVVELDAAIEHPDLASDRAALEWVRAIGASKR